MKKIIYIPLDERPCNYQFPQSLAQMTDIVMEVPPRNLLGEMKKPANVSLLMNWLKENISGASHLILSIDMLIYGGIVPSRLHQMSLEECLDRLSILRTLKELNPKLKIFVYDLIMRVPAYDSSEEEPDYYEEYGERIFLLGWFTDKEEQNLLTDSEQVKFQQIEGEIPEAIQTDYLNRRKTNFAVTGEVLKLVDKDIIDYLIIPLDDNSQFGFSPMEQRKLTYQIDRLNLYDQINVYPGADEIACTLFARVFCEIHQYQPEIFIRYSSTNGSSIIPKYEDRSLSESIKSHITSAGGVIVENDRDNHFVLMVHSPAVGQADMGESAFGIQNRHWSYTSEVNIREFVQAIKYYKKKGKNIALADVAVANGADISLMKVLQKADLFPELISYAGWNTNGNTMGTVVSHAVIASYYELNRELAPAHYDKNSRDFFYSRLVEDWAYQSIVRKSISQNVLPGLGLTPRYLKDQVEEVTRYVEKELIAFIEGSFSKLPEGKLHLYDVHLPWNRMFEVGFSLELEESKETMMRR